MRRRPIATATSTDDATVASDPLHQRHARPRPQRPERQTSTTETVPSPRRQPFLLYYRFVTPSDEWRLTLAVVAAISSGAVFPVVLAMVVARMLETPGSITVLLAAAQHLRLMAAAIAALDYVASLILNTAAEREARTLRTAVFRHVLRLPMPWHDKSDQSDLVQWLSKDSTQQIQRAMSSGLGGLVRGGTTCIVGMALATWYGTAFCWVYVLAPVGATLVGVVLVGLVSDSVKGVESDALDVATLASARNDNEMVGLLTHMRALASLNAQDKAIARLREGHERLGVLHLRDSVFYMAVVAIILLALASIQQVVWWVGLRRVIDHASASTDVVLALVSFSVSLTAAVKTFVVWWDWTAIQTTQSLFGILDTSATSDESGFTPSACKGEISFRDVHVSDPINTEKSLLRDLNLHIAAHETVALVSTNAVASAAVASLLQRFYDPQRGEITLDGKDIEDLDRQWLCAQIRVVPSRPVLFDGTVLDNITIGADGLTRDDAMEAAARAGVHDVIMALPEQYNTRVGGTENSLSIPQQRRICLARALVRSPAVLVVEDLETGNDNEDFDRVLMSLQQTTPMTTLLVTDDVCRDAVRRANKIVVFSEDRVVESGTHDDLMAMTDGLYETIYDKQSSKAKVAPAPPTESPVTDKTTPSDASSSSIMEILQLIPDPWSWTLPMGVAAALIVAGVAALAAVTSSTVLSLTTLDSLNTAMASVKWLGLASVVLVIGVVAVIFVIDRIATNVATVVWNRQVRALLHQPMQVYKESPQKLTDRLRKVTADIRSADDAFMTVAIGLCALAGVIIVGFLTCGRHIAATGVLGMCTLHVGSHWLCAHQLATREKAETPAADALIAERLGHVRTIASLGIQDKIARELDGLVFMNPIESMKRQLLALTIGLRSSILPASWAIVLAYSGMQLENETEVLSNILRLQIALPIAFLLMEPIGGYLSVTAEAVQKCTSAMDEIKALESSVVDPHVGERPSSINGQIEFRDVTFSSDGNSLERCSVRIEAGETVAVIGAEDEGIQQFTTLLHRFDAPKSGTISLDDRDLETLSPSWLRLHIGVLSSIVSSSTSVPPALAPGTIADNIAYGLHYAPTPRKIEMAARLVGAHDAIADLPEAYATEVFSDENGNNDPLDDDLIERIGIARVLIRDPSILIVDEIGLERQADTLQEALTAKKRTTIVLTRRVATLVAADKIVVLQHGQVVEQGTHTQLSEKGRVYKTLVNTFVGVDASH